MKDVAIITSGYFPVPPVLGGAIETLIDELINENEIEARISLIVFSVYDKRANSESKKYKHTKFRYVRVPLLIKLLDVIIYNVAKYILKKEKHLSYRYIVQRLYYIFICSYYIAKRPVDRVIIENHMSLLNVMRLFGNQGRYRGKVYYHAHNVVNGYFGGGKYVQELAGFICVSNYIVNAIKEQTGYTGEYIVLRNKVDEHRFKNIDREKTLEFKRKILQIYQDDDIIISFTGRLTQEKGILELLEAYSCMRKSNCILVVAGSYYFGSGMNSKYENSLDTLRNNIKNRVIFTGFIEYNDMPYLYAMSDIMVVPSIWDDPAPLTVIESLTVGKPLITTNSGGIPEYVSDNTAIVVDRTKNLVDELKNALESLAENKEKRLYLSENAKRESLKWTRKSYYNDFLSIIGD